MTKGAAAMGAKESRGWLRAFVTRKPAKALCRAMAVVGLAALTNGCITSMLIMRHHFKQGGYIEDWSKKDGQETTGLVYNAGKGLKYDLYIPAAVEAEANTPLLLLVHGGAWNSGNRQDISYACKYYAKHGCIAATLDYSLVSDKHPEVTIYTMLDEITECIGAIKAYLAEHGYKAPRIAIGGFSAGGHLALLYSYSRAAESPIPIAFVFEKVGPSDFGEKAWGAEMSAGLVSAGTGRKVAAADLGLPESQHLVASLSPVSCVTANTVPTIFAYGGKDNLVKGHHRDVLAEALATNGVAHVAVDFPNSHHGMWSDPDRTEEFRKAVLTYCQTYMREK